MTNQPWQGRWRQIKGTAKLFWGRASGNLKMELEGHIDQLMGRIQSQRRIAPSTFQKPLADLQPGL